MVTIKSYTDIEQSKKLAEILPIESADMCHIKHCILDNLDWRFDDAFLPLLLGDKSLSEILTSTLPCWSLTALLDALPKEIVYDKHIVYLEFHAWDNFLEYVNNADYTLYVTESYDNPIDACYEMILKLHEQNLI